MTKSKHSVHSNANEFYLRFGRPNPCFSDKKVLFFLLVSFLLAITLQQLPIETRKCLPCFVLMENPSLVNASLFLLIPWTLPYVAMCGYLLLNNKNLHAMKI